MTAMVRPNSAGHEAGADSYEDDPLEDDPLVELARIVSSRPDSAAAEQRASAFREDSGMTEADLARGLEAELLSDLRATFAANGESAEYDSDAAEYPGRPDEHQDLRPQSDQDYAPREHIDERGYGDSDAAGADLPPLPSAGTAEADFSSLNLRSDRGPAYDPSALSADDFDENLPTEPISGPDSYPEEEPLLDPESYGEEADRRPAEDTFADPAEWDLDPHPHIAEVAAGATEPAYLDNAEAYDREEIAPVRSPATRHRDPRLDADPLGEARYRRRGGIRLYPLLGVIMILGLGAAAILVLRGGGTALEPVLVAADTSPTRVFPEPEPPAEADNVVFNRLNPDAPPPEENLLAPAEPAADLAATPEANDGITQILTPTDPAAAGLAADPELPRMVRTVTVLPDGTIVDNETAPAVGEAPVAANPAGAEPRVVAVIADPLPADPPATDPIAVAAIDPAAADPVLVAVEPAIITPLAPAQPNLTVANLPNAGDPIAPGFYVQVTAQGSEQAAQAQVLEFRARAPSLLGGRSAIIQRAELEQGVFYRVKFGPLATRAEAVTLVESLRAAGMDGFIANH